MNLDLRLKEVMSAVLGIPAEEIDESTSTDTVSKWDSMRSMSLVLSLEEEFNVQFTDAETITLLSYRTIKQTLVEKGVS